MRPVQFITTSIIMKLEHLSQQYSTYLILAICRTIPTESQSGDRNRRVGYMPEYLNVEGADVTHNTRTAVCETVFADVTPSGLYQGQD